MLIFLDYLLSRYSKMETCSSFFLLVFSYSHNPTPVWAVVSEAFQFLTNIHFCSFMRLELNIMIVVKCKKKCVTVAK